jgi:hypothetical protein
MLIHGFKGRIDLIQEDKLPAGQSNDNELVSIRHQMKH